MNQSAPSAHPGNSAQANPRMTPVRGLLVLVAVLVFVTTYLILSHAMGLTESWSGFLFLVCWAVSHMVPFKLTGCALGAFVGVLTAYALQRLPPVVGVAAGGSRSTRPSRAPHQALTPTTLIRPEAET